MSDVFLEREFDPPLIRETVLDMAVAAGGCFNLHGIDWGNSLLSADGGTMLCHFIGPDTESVRIALRQMEADLRVMWPGTIHDRPELTDDDLTAANVIVERSFDLPTDIDDIQAIEDKGAWCLEAHNVRFIRTFFSVDRKRMICLYSAPDAESVRLAQRQAGMPIGDVWSFTAIGPDDLQTTEK